MPLPLFIPRSAPLKRATAAGGFVPTDVSGCVLWLKASTGLYDATSGGSPVTGDGNSIARWEDQSGTGNHFTQGTSANQPILKTSIVNGKSVIRFDGTNDYVTAANSAYNQPNTIFVVASITGNASSKCLFSSNGFNENTLYADAGEVLNLYCLSNLAGSGSNDTTWRLYAALANSTSSKLWINGTQNGSTGDAGSSHSGTFRLGSNGSLGAWMYGDIAEIIFYNASVSDGDRADIETYLDGEYNLW